MKQDVYVLAGARTPFAAWASGRKGDGSAGGALKDYDPFDLGAHALMGALDRAGLGPEALDRVVFGNMYQSGPHGCYGARYVSHRAGVPPSVPSLTVNFSCGTGLQAVLEAAQDIETGEAELIAAGGADCVSRLRKDIFVPSFNDLSCARPIGQTADEMAAQYGIGRAEQDAWALESHRRARQAEALSAKEIVPLGTAQKDDHVLLKDLAEERVFGARPAYGENGTVTSANTHALVDGGSALILGSASAAGQCPGKPLGRVIAGAYAAVAPDKMPYGSIPAVRRTIEKAGWKIEDVDLWEINETFAAQILIDCRELSIPPEKINVNGGALALGHPFAATGAKLILGLLLEMERRGLKRGIAAICVGGGQGVAAALESV